MNKGIFFDRDGVLNPLVARKSKDETKFTAPWKIEEFNPFPDVNYCFDILKKSGYLLFIISNQPDYYDGRLKLDVLNTMDQWYRGHGIDDSFYGFDRGSQYYKPSNLSIERFCNKYHIDKKKSYMVGDGWRDVIAAKHSNLRIIQIGDECYYQPHYRCLNLTQVTDYIIDQEILTALGPKERKIEKK